MKKTPERLLREKLLYYRKLRKNRMHPLVADPRNLAMAIKTCEVALLPKK